MSFFSDDYVTPRKRRVKSGSFFPSSVPVVEVRRLNGAEPPYDQEVFLANSVPSDGPHRTLPRGLVGHVPPARGWEKSDKAEWKTKKLCLVAFPGRGTFQVPISALALS